MITKRKIQKIELKCNQIDRENNQIFTIRHVARDGRLMNEDGYLLDSKEIELQKDKDEKISRNGGVVIKLIQYREPKIKLV